MNKAFGFILTFVLMFSCVDPANTPYSLRRKQKTEQAVEEIKKYFNVKKAYEVEMTETEFIDFLLLTTDDKVLVFRKNVFDSSYKIISMKRRVLPTFVETNSTKKNPTNLIKP